MKCRSFLILTILFLGVHSSLAEEIKKSEDPLVEIQSIIPDAVLDVRYATQNNFLKESVYNLPKVFLRKSVAERLKLVADKLRSQDFRLKIFDGYRPLSVQKKMWAMLPDSRYVANPQRGSVHNRGGAVDLTLITLEGREVEMPSEFDDFSEKAHHDNPNATPQAKKDANLLRKTMQSVGFEALSTEWWHYTDPRSKSLPVLDISFEELGKQK